MKSNITITMSMDEREEIVKGIEEIKEIIRLYTESRSSTEYQDTWDSFRKLNKLSRSLEV